MPMKSTRGFIIYLVSGFSIAVLSALFLTHHDDYKPSLSMSSSPSAVSLQSHARYGSETVKKVWPELEASWRLVLATVIGFLGSACGTVGGVGGGGIFVPMLTLLVGFDTKSAAALSKLMVCLAAGKREQEEKECKRKGVSTLISQ